MIGTLKQLIRRAVGLVSSVLVRTRLGRLAYDEASQVVRTEVKVVVHDGTTFRFATPNALCGWRAATFAEKEPETLEWIDAFPEGAVLWDIGANIGLYAVYAAVRRRARVWAFEPSVFNLEVLARNIHSNEVSESVTIVPLALAAETQAAQMRLTSTDWGGALSTFGERFGWDGQAIHQVFHYSTLGTTMTNVLTALGVDTPHFVKMDVDGLEHFILRGGASVLAQVQGVLIEVNDDFHEQAEQCQALLTGAGLTLVSKRQSEMVAASTAGFASSHNQISART